MALMARVGALSTAFCLPTVPLMHRGAHPSASRAGAGARQLRSVISADSRKGGTTVDRPSSTTLPGAEKSTQGSKKRPPIYKVLLHNDTFNKREYVVMVLTTVVEGMSADDAMRVMQEAHEEGMALVIACSQEEAEAYTQTLRKNGLTSTLEPGC